MFLRRCKGVYTESIEIFRKILYTMICMFCIFWEMGESLAVICSCADAFHGIGAIEGTSE